MVAEALYDRRTTRRAANMRAILDELPESFAIKFSSAHREAPGERTPQPIKGCGFGRQSGTDLNAIAAAFLTVHSPDADPKLVRTAQSGNSPSSAIDLGLRNS